MKTKKGFASETKLSLLCASLIVAGSMTGCSKDQTEIPGPQAPTNIETKGNNGNIGMPGLPGGAYPANANPLLADGSLNSFFTQSDQCKFRTTLPTNFKSISATITYLDGRVFNTYADSIFPPGVPGVPGVSENPNPYVMTPPNPYVMITPYSGGGNREFQIYVCQVKSSLIKISFRINTK